MTQTRKSLFLTKSKTRNFAGRWHARTLRFTYGHREPRRSALVAFIASHVTRLDAATRRIAMDLERYRTRRNLGISNSGISRFLYVGLFFPVR